MKRRMGCKAQGTERCENRKKKVKKKGERGREKNGGNERKE